MKTGLESLDTGAPEITYSGNQGPKSPQEDQRMMQEFQMEQMAGGENDRVRELLLLEETQGLTEEEKEELRQLIKTISAQLPQGGLGDMPMDMEEDPRTMAANGGSMDFAMQGGVKNYLGNQETVSDVPVKWQSGPDKPDTELAYITKAEKDLLLKKDIHGSLQDGPNTGPEGIMSLDSQGDKTEDRSGGKGPGDGPGNQGNFRETSNITNTTGGPRAKGPTFSVATGGDGTPFIGSGGSGGETALERLREEGVKDFNLPIPYVGTVLNNKFVKTLRNKGLKKNIDYFLEQETDYPQTLQGYKDYMKDRLEGKITASGNQLQQGGGGSLDINNNQNLLITTGITPGTGTDTDIASGIPYRGDQFLRADNQLALAADGGLMRQPAAFGGIMGDDGRRAYGLGSIFKKAARAIKKVAKSPIGKAALLYAGGTYLGGMSSLGGAGGSFMSRLKSPSNLMNLGNFFKKDITKKFALDNINNKRIFGGITALSSLPLFMGQEEEDEDLDSLMSRRGPSMNPRGIREYIAANKGRVDPNEYAFLQPNFYAADGGRIDYADGGIGKLRGALSNEQFGYDEDDDDIKKLAMGGSTGMPPVTMMSDGQNIQSFGDDESMTMAQGPTMANQMPMPKPMMDPRMMQQMMMAQRMNPQMMGNRMMAAMGGRMNYAEGGDEGELLDMGGMEKDYRNDGGFVPMGEYERKDDVPARLSKNEFVFTADAVRNAGGGDIDKGAEIMENMMTNLENGGKVSQGSQGLEGAREMFQTQQRLGEVL